MSRFKMLALIALFTLALGLALMGEAVAEKVKGRLVNYTVKSQAVDIPDQEGHVLYVYEQKGIQTIFEGLRAKKLWDGTLYTGGGIAEWNPQTKQWSGRGHNERIDRDGDKVYGTWECQTAKEGVQGTIIFLKGTGKYEGIKGKATFSAVSVAPNQTYVDFEGEVEWPR
ncbi:MAG: hypothetical protein QHH30_07925 [candidate division NC10 bacterium]|nr:hypothetical protein [candidate division NC10 bacterium]